LDLDELYNQTRIRQPHDATVTRRGGRKHVEEHDPRTSVTMPTPGGLLTLFFDAPPANGPAREARIILGAEPWRLIPRLPLWENYARAMVARDLNDQGAALRALRAAGSGVRGHGDDFYRAVAAEYDALVAADSPAPIKTIAETANVTIGASSRWVKKARELGYITEGATDAS
jgi:hypothetical protein